MNRLFTASGSSGTKLPYWRTKDVLGQQKWRKLQFYMMSALCLCCPRTSLALQHSRQTDFRLRKQSPSRDATTAFPAKRRLRKNRRQRISTQILVVPLIGSSKVLTPHDQSYLGGVTSSIWSFCTSYTRVSSITSRCSGNEPTLLPWTDSGMHGFAIVNYHQSDSYLLKSSRQLKLIFLQHILNGGCKFLVWCGALPCLRAFWA